MERVVGPRMIRKRNGLSLVVQQKVFSRNARAATQGTTHIAGNPEIHTNYVQGNRNPKSRENNLFNS